VKAEIPTHAPLLRGLESLEGNNPTRPGSRTQTRLTGIDAARGIAMLLVCASHVRIHFIESAPWLYFLMTAVTRIATPTFLLLSGFVAAYVLSSSRSHARATLVDRGLFVLIVGHFLLDWSDVRFTDAAHWIFGRVTVTDAIGICLITSVVAFRLSARALATLGAALCLAAWPIAMLAAPETEIARYVGAALFDLRSEANAMIDAAVIPYMGVFLVGMALSKRSHESIRSGRFERIARDLAGIGTIAIAVVIVGIVGWMLAKTLQWTPDDPATAEILRRTLDPRSKMPPGPAYLLFYGGCGLLVAASCLIAKPRAIMEPIVKWAATIGRASLMSFVVQDWFFRFVPSVAGYESVTSVAFWLSYLVVIVLIIHRIAAAWDSIGANRFLTVGLRNRHILARNPG
jgi:uncharacterized membrane protein